MTNRKYFCVEQIEDLCYLVDPYTGEFDMIYKNGEDGAVLKMSKHNTEVGKTFDSGDLSVVEAQSKEDVENCYINDAKFGTFMTGPLYPLLVTHTKLSKAALSVLSVLDGTCTYKDLDGSFKVCSGVQARNYWFGTKKEIVEVSGMSGKHLSEGINTLVDNNLIRVVTEDVPKKGCLLLKVHPQVCYKCYHQDTRDNATFEWNKEVYGHNYREK